MTNKAALHSGADSVVTTQFADNGSVDSFSRQRISQPYGLFDNKFLTSKNHNLWDERLTGCIMVHGVVTGTFTAGQTFIGSASKYYGVITEILSPTSFTYSTIDNSFTVGETITTATGSASITSIDTGAHVEYQYDRASVALKLGTVQGQHIIRQTYRYFPYVSGYSHLINTTQVFNEPKAGLKQTVMYGDNLNGLGIVVDGLTVGVMIRSNTSGSVVDTIAPQTSWNIDNLSGDGPEHGNPSGLKLDISKNQIQVIDFQWLGVGRVRFGLNVDGKVIYVHEFKHANNDVGVYMRTPSLPIRYEIENVTATSSPSTLEQICCAVASEGGYAIPGLEFSASHGIAERALASQVKTPVLTIRLKNASENGGRPVRHTVKLLNSGGFGRSGDVYIELAHVHEPRSFTGTWVEKDDSSVVMVSKDVTAFTAHHIHELESDLIPANTGGTKTSTIDMSISNNHNFLSQNIDCDNSDMFVVYATSRTGTAQVSAHITWIEYE